MSSGRKTFHPAAPRAAVLPRRTEGAARAADRGTRFVIAVLSAITLGAILAIVEEPTARMILGALVMGFLTWSAYTSASQPRIAHGPPSGVRERRNSHTLRHRVNEFLRGVRVLDALAHDTVSGRVPKETGEKVLGDAENRLHDLVREIRGLAGRNV